jgi:hypothetical protein
MNYRVIRTFGIVLAAAIVLALTGTAQTACNVVYTISPQNSSAFGAAITIQNTGTTAWTSWSLTWAFANGQTVASLWNGIETQSGANVTVKNEPYNGSVAAGGNVSGVGFNGTWNGTTNAVPTSFAVNGTTCGVPISGFTLTPSATALTVALGASGTDTITVKDTGTFTGSVAFTATGMPTGVTASFSPTSSTTSSVLTLAVAATTVAGSYPITITGTSGTLTPVTTIVTLTVPPASGFTLTPSATALTVALGASGTDTITVKDTGTFTGSVAFTASGMPTGVTASFSPTSSTTSSVLTLAVAATTVTGSYPITVTGTSGTLTPVTTSITLTVTGLGSFSLSASPASLTVAQGASGTDTITVTDVSPFAGSVTFAATGQPTGVTATFSPTASTSSSVVTLAVASTTVAGTYPITITGTSGTLKATTSISLIVGPTTGGACQVIYTITPQSSTAFGAAITIENTSTTALSSWTLTWTFANGQTISSLWNGIETQSGANVTVKNESYNGSIPAGGSATGIGFNGTLNGSGNAVPTNFAVNGTACGGGGQGSFTLKPSAATVSVAPGATGTDTITVTDVSPFAGSVAFTASGMPTGVTAAFSPTSSTTSSVVTFTVAASTVAGSYPMTITGTSGTLPAVTTSITLTVTSSGFSVGPFPPISIPQCGSGSFPVPVTETGGFSGTITLSASGLPTGVAASFGPITSGSSTLALNVGCSVPPGTYSITITATSGTVVHTYVITITITAAGGFVLTPSAPTLSIATGASATDTITITDVSPFAGSVTLAATGMPTGVTATFGTNPATSTSLLTFTVAPTTVAGTYPITITGTSGTLASVVATITLTITGGTPANATVTVSQTSSGIAVSDTILGMNLASWYDVIANDAGVLSGFEAAGIKAVRWPGGSWSDIYHWSTNTNCFSTTDGAPAANDTFANFVSDIVTPGGLDVSLTADYGTDAACTGGGDPTEAAAWAAEAVSLGANVSHITVGNEEYGTWEEDLHAIEHDPTTYANAVATGYYPDIKASSPNVLVGVVVNPGNSPAWDPIVLADAKYDFVEYHYYPEAPGSENDTTLIQQDAQALTTNINTIKSELATAGHSGTPIYVGEIGATYSNPGKQSWSITQGLYAGQVLGEMMNDGVTRLTWWIGYGNCNGQAGNVSSSVYGWQNFGAYNVFSDGPNDPTCPTGSTAPDWGPIGTMSPTGRAFQLFSQVAVNGEFVLTPTVTGDTTDVVAYAATHSGGTALVLFNRNETTSETVSISLSAQTTASTVTVETYNKALYDETDATTPVWAAPTTTSLGAQSLPLTLTLTPWSMNVVIIH